MKLTKTIKLASGTEVPAGTELHFSNEGKGFFNGEAINMRQIPLVAQEALKGSLKVPSKVKSLIWLYDPEADMIYYIYVSTGATAEDIKKVINGIKFECEDYEITTYAMDASKLSTNGTFDADGSGMHIRGPKGLVGWAFDIDNDEDLKKIADLKGSAKPLFIHYKEIEMYGDVMHGDDWTFVTDPKKANALNSDYDVTILQA